MSSDEEKEVKSRRRYKRDPQDAQYKPQVDLKVPKKPKPLGAPKRPKSAYTLYIQASFDNYKKENPEMKKIKTKEIFKEMAAGWKDIDDEEKQKFEEEAKREKDDYEAKNKAYKKSAKYKRYKRDLKEWNEVYRDEYEEELYEKKLKKKEAKENPKEKKKTAKKKRGRKKKST